MKSALLLIVSLILLSGCGAVGLDKLQACGECIEGLGVLGDLNSINAAIEKDENVDIKSMQWE